MLGGGGDRRRGGRLLVSRRGSGGVCGGRCVESRRRGKDESGVFVFRCQHNVARRSGKKRAERGGQLTD
jgi:hypothetical protein